MDVYVEWPLVMRDRTNYENQYLDYELDVNHAEHAQAFSCSVRVSLLCVFGLPEISIPLSEDEHYQTGNVEADDCPLELVRIGVPILVQSVLACLVFQTVLKAIMS